MLFNLETIPKHHRPGWGWTSQVSGAQIQQHAMKGNHNIIPFAHICIITVQPDLMEVCKIVIKFYFLYTRTQIIHILLTANTILKLVYLHKAVASEIRRQWEIATIFFCASFRLNVPQVFGETCTYSRAGVMINLQLPTLVFLYWSFEAGTNRDSIPLIAPC